MDEAEMKNRGRVCLEFPSDWGKAEHMSYSKLLPLLPSSVLLPLLIPREQIYDFMVFGEPEKTYSWGFSPPDLPPESPIQVRKLKLDLKRRSAVPFDVDFGLEIDFKMDDHLFQEHKKAIEGLMSDEMKRLRTSGFYPMIYPTTQFGYMGRFLRTMIPRWCENCPQSSTPLDILMKVGV